MSFNTKIALAIVALLIVVSVGLSLRPQVSTQSYDGDFSLTEASLDRSAGVAANVEAFGLAAEDFAYKSGGEDPASLTTESHIIYNGSVDMRVNSVADTMSSLADIAATHNGYIQYSYIDRTDTYVDGHATLRVSAETFQAAMNDVQQIATSVYYVQSSSDDVTEQVVDLQARLANARAEEASYLEVLDIATSVEDILDVRYYLSQVRETIERYEAQLEYYESATSLAVISVSMTEEVSLLLESDTFRPSQSVIEALQTVIRLAQNVVIAVIWVLIVGGAIIIPLGIIWWIGTAIHRRRQK